MYTLSTTSVFCRCFLPERRALWSHTTKRSYASLEIQVIWRCIAGRNERGSEHQEKASTPSHCCCCCIEFSCSWLLTRGRLMRSVRRQGKACDRQDGKQHQSPKRCLHHQQQDSRRNCYMRQHQAKRKGLTATAKNTPTAIPRFTCGVTRFFEVTHL